MKPHQRLASERELAKRYGVSNLLLRKALDRLAREGLVERVPRVGNFVKDWEHSPELTAQVGVVMCFPEEHAYTVEIFKQMETSCRKRQLMQVLKSSDEDLLCERDQIDFLLDNGIRSLAVSPAPGTGNVPYFRRLTRLGVRVVFFHRKLDIAGVPFHGIGFRRITSSMHRRMQDAGCRRIGFISRTYGNYVSTVEEREQGFLDGGNQDDLVRVLDEDKENTGVLLKALKPLVDAGIDGLLLASETFLPTVHPLLQGTGIRVAVHGVSTRLEELVRVYGLDRDLCFVLDRRVKKMCERTVTAMNEGKG